MCRGAPRHTCGAAADLDGVLRARQCERTDSDSEPSAGPRSLTQWQTGSLFARIPTDALAGQSESDVG